ncbi:hypothetical protein F4779DRAFT_597464 [Xylariaceae sp. FL0662B]|nr:hypothetical protein F4779DRAFT_597464 [Xylariaceae sp. FL0662B]
MASQQQAPAGGGGGGSAGYKRASRKGAPRKFACNWPGCDKIYSRAEHLQRHQLNHDPKEVYTCDVPDCAQTFVRPDLLQRHKKRHSASYIPRNRTSSFNIPTPKDTPQDMSVMPSPTVANAGAPRPVTFPPQPASAPRNASVLLTTDSPVQTQLPPPPPPPAHPPPPLTATQLSPIAHSSPWTPSMEGVNMMRPKPEFYSREPAPMHDQSTFVTYPNVQVPTDENGVPFGAWLFNPPTQGYQDISNIAFLEGGLESTFNNNIRYDHESLTSRSQFNLTPPQLSDTPDELISEYRGQEILHYVQVFYQKQSKYDSKLASLLHDPGGDTSGLSLEFLGECIRYYWDFVSPRLPIVHHPTFSPSRCSIFLVLVIIALGAAQMHNQDSTGGHPEYRAFADLIILHIRFELLAEGASPPVELWAVQALMLLEFYEKTYSTRLLHERAHVYHSVTLTLLRRGSPLIGQNGGNTTPDEQNETEQPAASDVRTWWIRWAETEAMHRVVFAAFMMDAVHAAMFGHTADMGPHEIRLPLPCDDSLWSASSPEIVRHEDGRLRMYGIKPVSFLDGLKRAIHGKEVQTHPFGRMIIMCGLLSVGWHIRHGETQLRWLELGSSFSETREKWCKMLLKAFDDWKISFDRSVGSDDSESDGSAGQRSGSNGLVQNASVLYHLAHISLYIDIVDCQVYAGAKALLGRKISRRDYTNVVSRMSVWAAQLTTRYAVLHAFKLLHRVLVDPRQKRSTGYLANGIPYSCRSDPDPHRPWIMYYATLSIWSFVRALGPSRGQPNAYRPFSPHLQRNPTGIAEYLTKVARLNELDVTTSTNLQDGLPELLDAVGALTAESPSELLKEACGRLMECKAMLHGGGP